MESNFKNQVESLYQKIDTFVNKFAVYKAIRGKADYEVQIPEDFKNEFLSLIDKVNLSLMEEKDNFYGYFIFQMGRDIRFNITTPTAVNFKGAKYVIYFNPLLFLKLDLNQMQTTIKHEIHHLIALHQIRAKDVKDKYSKLAINLAMDIVVNQYLEYLPPYAVTLNSVNNKYSLDLKPFNSFEYYAENIQNEFDLLEMNKKGEIADEDSKKMEINFDPEKTHDIWEEQDDVDEKTLREFTENYVRNAEKGSVPQKLEGLISSIKERSEELPWNIYLKKIMGTVESGKKKTITRRSRRQPERLDLRGEIRNHKAKIVVAIDISGSITDEEFKQSIKEVLAIVKNYNHEITIIECDNDIRSVYTAKTVKDVRQRKASGGGTKFTPVFDYANKKRINLLIYFTDGKGEKMLGVMPKGYRTLWVISGSGDKLSLSQTYGTIKRLKKVTQNDNVLDMKDVKNDGYSMNSQEPII